MIFNIPNLLALVLLALQSATYGFLPIVKTIGASGSYPSKNVLTASRISFHSCARYSRISPMATGNVQNVSQWRSSSREDSSASTDINNYVRLQLAMGRFELAQGNAALIGFMVIAFTIAGMVIVAFVRVLSGKG